MKAWGPFVWEIPDFLQGKTGTLEISCWTSAQPMFGDEKAGTWDVRFWFDVHAPNAPAGLHAAAWLAETSSDAPTGLIAGKSLSADLIRPAKELGCCRITPVLKGTTKELMDQAHAEGLAVTLWMVQNKANLIPIRTIPPGLTHLI